MRQNGLLLLLEGEGEDFVVRESCFVLSMEQSEETGIMAD